MIESLREKQRIQIALHDSEASLRELNHTKDRFFSIIAHDLRGSFNAILGFSNLLVKEYDEYEDAEKISFISKILDAAGGTFKLLENLLEWSQSQTGAVEYHKVDVDLHEMAQNNIDTLFGQSSYKGISVINQITDSISVFIDRQSINSVVRNLISNALKFTPRFGSITLEAKTDGKMAIISIKDTGVGISSDKIDKLFRIDTKVTTLGTEEEQGSGLGLILCQEFVKRNGGRIWVESSVGNGSTFFFTLPLSIS